jgi:hypothetical protein
VLIESESLDTQSKQNNGLSSFGENEQFYGGYDKKFRMEKVINKDNRIEKAIQNLDDNERKETETDFDDNLNV